MSLKVPPKRKQGFSQELDNSANKFILFLNSFGIEECS
jgi:hypothetical protein